MKPGRREFLGGAMGLVVAASGLRPVLAAEQTPAPMGAGLVKAYIQPAMHQFSQAAAALRHSLNAICRDDASTPPTALETDFRALVSAWSRISFLRFGPLVAENRYERIFFWPDPRGVMLRQIRPLLQGAQPVDDLRSHSVAVQGLPALEYVLYSDKGLLHTGASGADSALCRYALAIANNVAQIAQELWSAWGPEGAYARDFARPATANAVYRNNNEVLTETLKALSGGLRFEADVKLRTALGSEAEKARPKVLPFWRSELALLAQAEAVSGLAAFHTAAAFAGEPAWVEQSLNQELSQSADILQGRAGQVMRLAEDAELYRELKLVTLKLDNARRIVDENLAPALGVGLGFNALDGD